MRSHINSDISAYYNLSVFRANSSHTLCGVDHKLHLVQTSRATACPKFRLFGPLRRIVENGRFRSATCKGGRERVLTSIQEGIEAGEFSIANAEAGRDILLGAGLASAITLLNGQAETGHIGDVATGVFQALGVSDAHARNLVGRPVLSLSGI
jgi:hypothetical protein